MIDGINVFYIRFNKREGKRNMDLMSDNTPSTAKPNMRKGNNNNQMIGYNTKARIASGAQTANNISQSKKVIISTIL